MVVILDCGSRSKMRIAEVVDGRAAGLLAVGLFVDLLLNAAPVPAADFLVGLLASLRLAGGPQAAD